jgi:hypothetical protein
MQGGYGSSRPGFDDDFGFGGYKAPQATQPPPPPPPPSEPQGPADYSIPMPPIYGPLRQILNIAPPGHPYDQQPARLTVRINPPSESGTERVAIASGPGSESVVPFSLFSQMMIRMERLEKENEVLLKVVEELNSVIEKERGNELKVYEHASIGTSKAGPPLMRRNEDDQELPPWRIKK